MNYSKQTLVSLLFFFMLINISKATDLDVVFNLSIYNSGYNISCHGGNDGSIEAIIVGGTSPYSFSWSNGSFAKNIASLVAGNYTLTITDANNITISKTVPLKEPDLLIAKSSMSTFSGGYNISAQGETDGFIIGSVGGGTPPYTYMWSNGSIEDKIDNLPTGNYSLIATDANGCSATTSKFLSEPTPLHIVSLTSSSHHGFNISCYEGHDGVVNLTVAGGVPPYSFQWSSGSFDEDPIGLSSDSQKVSVTDANGAIVIGHIFLTQPGKLKVELTSNVYSNGFNLSCHVCGNGNLLTHVIDGVSPFSYLWESGQTSANLFNRQAGLYTVIVTDANGCSESALKQLTAPDPDSWSTENWSMQGNSSLDSTNYIGTTNGQDVIFKTNSTERLRITGSGTIRLSGGINAQSLIGSGYQNVVVDNNGNLMRGPIGLPPNANPCTIPLNPWFNTSSGPNDITNCTGKVGINTSAPQDYLDVNGAARFSDGNSANNYLRIGHNGADGFISKIGTGNLILHNAVYINDGGQVGIGVIPSTTLPSGTNYKLFVKDGIISEKVMVALKGNTNIWPDYVFSKSYKLKNIYELESFIKTNHHLPDLPAASELGEAVDLLKMQTEELKKIEELTLYVIQLQKDNDELRKLILSK